MRPLKICLATTFYPPFNFGGDGIFVYRLANALARQGHEVHVVHETDAFNMLSADPPKNTSPHHENITVHSLKARSLGAVDLFLSHQLGRPLFRRKELKAVLEGIDFDVIHFHNVSLLGGPDVLGYGRSLKLCTLNDEWFVCPMHVLWRFDREPCTNRTCLACTLHGRRPPQLWRYTGRLSHMVQEVDAFIGPSLFVIDIHHEHGFPKPIHHIPYFLPDTELAKVGGELEPFEMAEKPYFLYVGRLEKIKGVQVLIDTFRHYNEANLLIAGTGSYRQTLEEMAADIPHIRFLGLLDHAQLRPLYQNAIATLMPSLCYETFGWPIIESLMTQTPVIVPNLGALPEVVRATQGGLVYEGNEGLVEKMESLRTQAERRDQLGRQGFSRCIELYSEARHIDLYHHLITELITA